MLRSFGYDIISVGNADRSDYERTVVIYFSPDDIMAKAFADVINCTNIRSEFVPSDEPENQLDIKPFDYKADIRLIIGKDFNGRYVIKN